MGRVRALTAFIVGACMAVSGCSSGDNETDRKPEGHAVVRAAQQSPVASGILRHRRPCSRVLDSRSLGEKPPKHTL